MLQACTRKIQKKKPHVRRAVDDVIAEISIPTNAGQDNGGFELFLQRNDALIANLIADELRRHG